jgi:hypothetical protein
MRSIATILTFLAVLSAEAQSSSNWLRRWRTEQGEASVTLARLKFEEHTVYDLEGAYGPTKMEIESSLVVDRSRGTTSRSAFDVRTGPHRFNPSERRGRRRFRPPVRGDLLSEADRMLFPSALLADLEPAGSLDKERLDGRDIVRIVTVTRDESAATERVTWFFDESTGHLLRARAVIRGEERGTIVVDVRYRRADGLDLPDFRELSGSFPLRRRTRTFTVLVESRADYELTALEALE